MSLTVIIVRPEPGASATAAMIRAAGLQALVAPLFAATPLAWVPPDPTDFDAVLLTSANAGRYGGAQLLRYRTLPCWCVGPATAATATDFALERVGDGDATTLMAAPEAAGRRWLWLAGARHQPLVAPTGGSLTVVEVYEMIDLPGAGPLLRALVQPAVLLAHSAVAARRLSEVVGNRNQHHLVAISAAVAAAAGNGWRSCCWPDHPRDSEMVALATNLCMESPDE